MDDAEIARDLLRKFIKNGIFGAYHIREDTVAKGFPSHARGHVMRVAEELRRSGWLVKFPTGHGTQWYLNTNFLREVEEFIAAGSSV